MFTGIVMVVGRLRAAGLRPTRQRLALARLLFDKGDRHVTAEQLHGEATSEGIRVSLATVYNCLDTPVSCGLVRQVNFDRAPTRYCPNLHEHAHFHDETTGRVHDIDVPADVLARLRALLPAGFDASAVELSFRGSARSPRSVDGRGSATDLPN